MTPVHTFGPLTVRYDARVLTPRPWTLLQSAWAAELARHAPPGPLAELCAGAGHIGLAAAVLSDRDLVQVELDPVAAEYARANAEAVGWRHRVEVRVGSLQTAMAPAERFPVMIADPPYLPTAEIQRWPDDPPTAIDGGLDGLAVTRLCLAAAVDHLNSGGHLLLQTAGPRQSAEVAELAAGLPLRHCAVRVVDDARAVAHLERL
jgi:release factor glutamine methyltransferase